MTRSILSRTVRTSQLILWALGEQDTNLFASIRYNVLNETNFIDFNIRQVYPGDLARGTPPIHFSILQDAFPDGDQQTKSFAFDSIESHVGVFGVVLLKLYFRFVHPILPVLSKSRILRSYATNKLSISASLRGAIYGLACAFLTQDRTLKDIPPISQGVLFEHAHAALNRELDSPKLSSLQACLLILHQQPEVNGTTESSRIWVLACQATACAQAWDYIRIRLHGGWRRGRRNFARNYGGRPLSQIGGLQFAMETHHTFLMTR